MQSLTLTSNVQEYKNTIEKEIGIQIPIHIENGSLPFQACFDSAQISIRIQSSYFAAISQSEFDQCIAHELTHALLRFKENYPSIEPEDLENPIHCRLAAVLATSLEDIVVEKRILDQSLGTLPSCFNRAVEDLYKFAKRNKVLSYIPCSDPLLKQWTIISKLIMVWSYQQNFLLTENQQTQVKRMYKAFERNYHKEYLIFEEIKNYIISSNIYTSVGYLNLLKGLLIKWNLPIKLLISRRDCLGKLSWHWLQ